jgi:hypothetical protein
MPAGMPRAPPSSKTCAAVFDPQLNDGQRAIYLTAIAVLRAGHANQVTLLKRYGWVRDTVRMLDEAKQLTHGEAFVMRWMSGVVAPSCPASSVSATRRWPTSPGACRMPTRLRMRTGCAKSTFTWQRCNATAATSPRRSASRR